MHVENDLGSCQAGHQRREYEEVWQIVDMNHIELSSDQQAQTCRGRGQKKMQIRRDVGKCAVASVLADRQSMHLYTVENESSSAPIIVTAQ